MIEAQEAQVEVHVLQLGQFNQQQFVIPLGQLGGLVVCDPKCLDLRRRQVLGNVDRHLVEPQLLGSLPAGVATDDDSVAIDHDWLAKAEFTDRLGHCVNSSVVDS